MSTLDSTNHAAGAPTPFLDGSKSAILGLRRALAEVLESVGADASQPQDMSRRFGLDKTLTWRLARVIRESGASDAVAHIPRRPSIRIFLDKMRRHGAPAEKIDAVWKALEDFEQFVLVHSGDRETLEAMLGVAPSKAADKRMEAFRKNGFLANSAIWGIRARAQFALNVMAPSAAPGLLDVSTVCGLVGLRRLRPNVPWTIASAYSWDRPDGTPAGEPVPVPLHPDGLFGGVPVLPEFCSRPVPTLRTVRAPSSSRFELTEGPVGNTAAATVIMGWKWPQTATIYCERSPDEIGEHGVMLSTPVENLVLDLLVHRSLTFAMNPLARVYSKLPGGPQYPTEGRDTGRLPVPDEVIDLGADPVDTTTPELPRYREIVEFTAARMGLTLRDFHGFRYRLRYPPIPTMALLQHPLLVK